MTIHNMMTHDIVIHDNPLDMLRLTSIPMINDVIQELGLPKVVCDLLAQACMASGVVGRTQRSTGEARREGKTWGWGGGGVAGGVHGCCSGHIPAVGLELIDVILY